MIKKLLLSTAIVAVTATAGGQSALALPKGATLTRTDNTHVMISFAPGTAPKATPNNAVVYHFTATNFALKYPLGLYYCCYGATVTGVSSATGLGQTFEAVAYTPTQVVSDSGVMMAIGYISGQNAVNIGVWSDAGGVPGVELAGVDVPCCNLPNFGTCCNTVYTTWRRGHLNAGTRYWMVASTDANSLTTTAAANVETVDMQFDECVAAYNLAIFGGWSSSCGYNGIAAGILK